MKKQTSLAVRLGRVFLLAAPLAALLCSCGPQSGGLQKQDAATMKKIDEIAAQERGGAGAMGSGAPQQTPP